MSRLGQRDTAPELALRSELHRRGLRFRVDRAPLATVRSRADVVLGSARVAVYVDGCFWHRCPVHGTMPKANADFWHRKLQRNQERDVETNFLLRKKDWAVVRVWEHENPSEAADRIEELVAARRSARRAR
ncbi:MAG: DNA mismatch endonuclease Vsr [Solirubrobacterales bacterium]|nr:DNA mismatch endonuclease Vsr [Solirubrobacterales bacterium]